jgi:outer membrane protein TolC
LGNLSDEVDINLVEGDRFIISIKMKFYLYNIQRLFITISLFSVVSYAPPTVAKYINIKKYIQKAYNVSDEIEKSKAQKQFAYDSWGLQKNVYDSNLILSIGKQEASQNKLSNIVSESKLFNLAFTQLLPTGTSLSIIKEEYIDTQYNNDLPEFQKSKLSFRMEQSLYKNSFGSAYTKNAKAAEANYRQSEILYQQTVIDSCNSSTQIYLDTLLSQERLDLFTRHEKVLNRVFKYAGKAYKKSILKKIDYLSVKKEYLEAQLNQQASQIDYRSKTKNFWDYISEKNNKEQLVTIEPNFNFIKNVDHYLKKNNSLKALLKEVEVTEEQAKAQKDLSRTDVVLYSEYSSADTRIGRGTHVSDDNLFTIGLKFDIPIYNRGHSLSYKEKLYKSNLKKKEAEIALKSIKSRVIDIISIAEASKIKLNIYKDTLKVAREQISLGENLFKKGLIEYQELSSYISSSMKTQSNYLDTYSEFMKASINLNSLSGNTSEVCLGVTQ